MNGFKAFLPQITNDMGNCRTTEPATNTSGYSQDSVCGIEGNTKVYPNISQ